MIDNANHVGIVKPYPTFTDADRRIYIDMLALKQREKVSNTALNKAANRMTELVLTALGKFPPAERERRLKAYLANGPRPASAAKTSR